MLICEGCKATSTGRAWHWIALLERVPNGAQAVCYCPLCAESKFEYFSKQRAQRLSSDG
jgi:hypothetical protein